MNKLYDKFGREIMVGDTLKVFHFTGARRKRYYMYKFVQSIFEANDKTRYFRICHLSYPGKYKDDTYLEALDNRLFAYIEIVQGYGEERFPFDERPKTKEEHLVERVDRYGNLKTYVEE